MIPRNIAQDKSGVLVFPVHHGFEELFATQVMTRFTRRLVQALFNNGLRRDTRVIKAGNKQRSLSEHAVPWT